MVFGQLLDPFRTLRVLHLRAIMLVVSLLVLQAHGGVATGQESSGEQVQGEEVIVFLPRGDGTNGRFGCVNPTPQVLQTEWFTLDQKARRALLDDNLSESENLFKQAIQKAEGKGQYEPGVVNSLCGLSFLYHKKNNFQESDRVYEYAMRNLEGLSGRQSQRFGDFLSDLSWLYNMHSKPEKAEVLLKHAIAIREKDGPYSAELVKSLSEYADFLRKNNRDTEARHLDSRIKQIHDHGQE